MAEFRFQDPPDEYAKNYFSQLVRELTQTFSSLRIPSTVITGRLIFTVSPRGCPTVANGLPPGSVYADGDILKIVLVNAAYAPSFLLTAAVGTVVATG